MDQIKIGKFIAERRKNANLTQLQLAEKLNITDRAVSKWETGLAMPDSSIMLELCEILEISADELLRGELVKKDREEKAKGENPFKKPSYCVTSIPLMCAIVAFIFSIFTYGATGYCHEAYNKFGFEMSRKLIHFIFGGGELYNPSGRVSDTLLPRSGISLFGFLSFICLLASVILLVIYALNKKEGVYLFASFLLILSGILIVFILREGTKIQGNGWGGFELYEVFGNPRIGAGTIIWCVLCVLGGAFGVFDHYMKCGRTHSQKK